jgi:hypothetical protein
LLTASVVWPGGMARAYRYQAGPNLSSLAARPAERFGYN